MVQIADEHSKGRLGQYSMQDRESSFVNDDPTHLDEEWEDLPEDNLNLANPLERSPPPLKRTGDKVRRRKTGQKTEFVAQPNSFRKILVKQKSFKDVFLDNREHINQAVADGAISTLSYFWRIFVDVFRGLRYPLTFLLLLWILAFLMGQLSHAFHTVFSPLCYLPGTSGIPFCRPATPRAPQWADFPKLMDVQSSTFEQLLDSTVGSSELSLEVKKAEMATSDLVTLVKVSDLKSKEILSRTLEEFVLDAKTTGRGLQKLGSKIAGAVDSIVAVNDHALHTIEESERKHSGLIVFWPLSSGMATRNAVRETFADAMGVLSNQVSRIILEAEASIVNLDRLEERLLILYEIVSREDKFISAEKADLLAELWTILGGNRRRLRGLEGHTFLLRNIGEYRRRAQAHVVAAMQTLQGMSEDMEDIRERVAAPEIVGERIPIEVHIKSISAGLERLTQKRIKAQEREEEAMRRMLGADE
ncbi:hypothetical protein EUX98_g1928 [Antrodiella citrinella]|uniref:Uncharacterized protein n=1 Tax=Antrodiella citrinella TaxID=2447956 RepID=A0A4V3XJA0_9APHY|nr:hypothetical protein EUX98_g1928 [Antrodiella citrinella]